MHSITHTIMSEPGPPSPLNQYYGISRSGLSSGSGVPRGGAFSQEAAQQTLSLEPAQREKNGL